MSSAATSVERPARPLAHPPLRQQPGLLRRIFADPVPVLDELAGRYGPVYGLDTPSVDAMQGLHPPNGRRRDRHCRRAGHRTPARQQGPDRADPRRGGHRCERDEAPSRLDRPGHPDQRYRGSAAIVEHLLDRDEPIGLIQRPTRHGCHQFESVEAR